MANARPVQDEQSEAVIISGPRKGEFIRVSDAEPVLTAAEAALLDSLTETAWRIAESARAAAAEADSLLEELRNRKVR